MNRTSITPSKEFAAYGLMLAKANGDVSQAAELAMRQLRASHPRVELILRSAVGAGTTTDAAWAGSLVDYQQVAATFIDGLRSISPFDAILPFARRLPLNTTTAVVTSSLNGATPSEGATRPVSRMVLASGGLAPKEAVCLTVVSEELLRFSSSAAMDLINRELSAGVAASTSREFLVDLASGLVAAASTNDPLADLRAALTTVTTHGTSRPFWIVHPLAAVQLATYPGSGNEPAFPGMTPNGGTIAGVTVMVSDQVPIDSSGPLSLVVDADQIAVADETIVLRATRFADVVMDDSPLGGASEVVSMFQTNSVALLAKRRFGSQRLQVTAVAVISGAEYLPS